MLFRATLVGPFVLLALGLQLVAARSFRPVIRQEDGAQASPTPSSVQISSALDASPGGSLASSSFSSPAASGFGTQSFTSSNPSATSSTESNSPTNSDASGTATQATASPTATGSFDGSQFLNATIPAGQLPLKPELTPGWGVAGVLMLTTGLIYTLIGIKNQWVHTFFSTAYMTALGISVLIIYVMSVPVSHAVQGGYVVAVVVSGCLVGGASMFFKELTEGLGCALGGFCISMWLLCLVPGGLLHPVAAKAVFIAAFTVVGFAFYFSRWTRDWALIILISFAGATITILGIDCFSRAGLKEFWVYLWNVNNDLFPLGADTYPVTKGIRVETAGIIVIFLMGIISQIKLWRIVREKRHKRAAERAEGQRNLDIEEEAVGRQIEEANARDRRQWERVYGDGTIGSSSDCRTSDLGDGASEKKLGGSHSDSSKSVEVIEMANISESDHGRHGPTLGGPTLLMTNDDGHDSKVTIRVGADEVPTQATQDLDEKSAGIQHSSSTRSKRLSQQTWASRRISSQTQTISEAPEVIPLPFNIPIINNDGETPEDGRSSVATFAEEDADALGPAQAQPTSFYKRLSRGSASLLRSLSQKSGRGGDDVAAPPAGDSSEELVIPRQNKASGDDAASLAATVDVDSMSGGDIASVGSLESRRSIEIKATLADKDDRHLEDGTDNDRKQRSAMLSPTAAPAKAEGSGEGGHRELESTTATAMATQRDASGDQVQGDQVLDEAPEQSSRPKSGISVTSTHASLTKEKLPPPLSKVARSYRTNEWAKHLSYADIPDPDDEDEHVPQVPHEAPIERIAPLDAVELQKTAQDGAPPPAMSVKRSESQASMASFTPALGKKASKVDFMSQGQAQQDRDTQGSRLSQASGILRRSSSRQEGLSNSSSSMSLPQERDLSARSLASAATGSVRTATRRASSGFQPIVEERPGTLHADAIPEEPSETDRPISMGLSHRSSVVSYANPQTLMGQREMFIRNKSQGSLIAPEPPFAMQPPGSDSGSISPRHSLAAHAPSPMMVGDPDDIPLSQRKQIMRQSSLMSLHSNSPWPMAAHESSENVAFNSHQPKRTSTLPSPTTREAQLANFRQSVKHDLRAGTPILAPQGRETPFKPSSLLGNREAEVQRNIEMQRNVLIGQKEAEAQRLEMQRLDKENADRIFDERMRTGSLLGAHREAMRKMQKAARDH